MEVEKKKAVVKKAAMSYRIKGRGYEEIFSEYNLARVAFDKLKKAAVKEQSPVTIQLEIREGLKGEFRVIDSLKLTQAAFNE